MPRRLCSIPGCGRRHFGRGWCGMHYRRWERHGDPLACPPTAEERFWAKVDKTDTCWLWTAHCNAEGYGRFTMGGRGVQAHRVAYGWLIGPIADGMELDHACRVRHCVNPWHLEPVTAQVNTLRGIGPSAVNARKTHCPRGHEFTGDNVLLCGRRRRCKKCQRVTDAAYQRQKRARVKSAVLDAADATPTEAHDG